MSDNNRVKGYPSPLASKAEKQSMEYGKQYAQAMFSQIDRGNYSYSYDKDSQRFIENEKYAAGLNDVGIFRQQMSITGDSTYSNFNYAQSTTLPKTVENLVGKLLNLPHKPSARPIDSLSKTEEDKERRKLEAKMLMRELDDKLEKSTGKIKEKGFVPEDEEQLELYMNTEYKNVLAVAMEEIMDTVWLANDGDEIRQRLARDLIVNNKFGAEICLDENLDIIIKPIDFVEFVSDFTKDDKFRDTRHKGFYRTMTISEVRLKYPQLTEEELYKMAQTSGDARGWAFSNKRYYNNIVSETEYNDFMIRVIDFEVRTTEVLTLRDKEAKNGGYYYQLKERGFKAAKNPKRKEKVEEREYEVFYDGMYVPTTQTMLSWKRRDLILRDRLNGCYSSRAKSRFICIAPNMKDMRNKSKVEEMIPFADKQIMYQLKIAQEVANAAPSGYAINVDSVVEALKGMGMGHLKPIDARAITNQIGDVYFKSMMEDGTPLLQNSQPIMPLPNGLSASIMSYVELYNKAVNDMRSVVGLPPVADMEKPEKDSLVGLEELSLAAFQDAFRTTVQAYNWVNKEVSSYVCIAAQELIYQGVKKEFFETSIGSELVEAVEMKRLGTADYSIQIDMMPKAIERIRVQKYLELSVQGGLVPPDVASRIEYTIEENPQKAQKLLEYTTRRQQEKMQQQELQKIEANNQGSAQAAQAAAQAQIQVKQQEAQADIMKLQEEYRLKIDLANVEHENKMKEIALEGEQKVEQIEVATDQDSESKGNLKDTSIKAGGIVKEPAVMPSTRI